MFLVGKILVLEDRLAIQHGGSLRGTLTYGFVNPPLDLDRLALRTKCLKGKQIYRSFLFFGSSFKKLNLKFKTKISPMTRMHESRITSKIALNDYVVLSTLLHYSYLDR